MRYRSEGEVHKDFHGLTCATIHYLVDRYGMDAVREIMTNTAQKVYRTIREALQRGDASELAEFWQYYWTREGADFSVETLADGLRLVVRDCPALRHLVKLGQKPDPILCEATRLFNDALAQGTPYAAKTEQTGEFSCVQTFAKDGGVR